MKDANDRPLLKPDTLYKVTKDYHREVLPLVYDLKKDDLVKLEKTFDGNVRVLNQNPIEPRLYLSIIPLKDARKILIEQQ